MSGLAAGASEKGWSQCLAGVLCYKNLGEALKGLLARHLAEHRKRKMQEQLKDEVPASLEQRSPQPSQRQERIRQVHRQERLAQYDQVVALVKQGLRQGEIARQVGVSLRTVQRWLADGAFPERKPREQSSQLDPYLPFILQRWSQGCHNVMQIYRELVTQGYKGSYGIVYDHLRDGHKKPARCRPLGQVSVSSRQATWLLLRRPEELTAEERETVTALRQLHPEIELAYGFVQQFAQMLRTRGGEKLDGWLQAVESSGLADLQSFVTGVYQDQAAVQAGLTLPWSNGQTEGQITRLKLIKRQMDGRARFDLLRQRVLHAA